MSNTRPCSYEKGKGEGLRIRKEIQVRNTWCVGAAGEEGLKERKKGRECSMRKKRRATFDMGCKKCVHGNGLHLWMLLALPFSCPPLYPLAFLPLLWGGLFAKSVMVYLLFLSILPLLLFVFPRWGHRRRCFSSSYKAFPSLPTSSGRKRKRGSGFSI